MIDMNSTPASLPKAGLETAGKVCKLGLTTDEVVRGYNDWSKESKYEQVRATDKILYIIVCAVNNNI